MKEINPSEHKEFMTRVMDAVDAFCLEHGLLYHLAYGSLLGAIRHNGFIPWDDDIDIWMPRPDYEYFKNHFKHEYYKFISADVCDGYPLDYAKVHDSRTVVVEEKGDGEWGFFIDIFPLDGIPSLKRGHHMFERARILRRLSANQRFTYKYKVDRASSIQKNTAIIIGKIIHPFITLRGVLKLLDNINKHYSFAESEYCGDLCSRERIYRRIDIIPTIIWHFEGRKFLVPKNYDEILRIVYGNYMELPPVEKRVSNHGIKAYWKE